ncbi:MAG: CotH kinase family protein [Bacteroidaceae bacterium]|nr:CotH kinase family protein [Bacteroidaceae bacterium]
MKRIFLSILSVALSILGAQASKATQTSEFSDATWYYTISAPNGGDVVTTEENGTMVMQNYVKTKLYNLDAETEGIRFTVVETNQPNNTANGFCFFVLGEFRVLDADGNPVAYTVTSNCDHNEFNGKDGDGLPALSDGVLNNYFHSNYGAGAPGEYQYIELTFEKPINKFSLEWYGRPNKPEHEFSPTLCGITPKGCEFTKEMLVPWNYTISEPNGGKVVTTEENGTMVTQNCVKTKLCTLDTETEGIRFTVVETNQPNNTANGFCYFVLGEFRVLDADGNPVAYTVTSNCDYNEHNNNRDGEGLPALSDGVLNNYFHSNYGAGAPGEYQYLEFTFEKPIKAFSLEWYGRPNNTNYEFSPTLCGITPKGCKFTENMIDIDDPIGGDDDDDIIYNTIDVFTEPCMFVSLADGGIDAYPLNTLEKEQYQKGDTLYVPLTSGNTIKYHTSEYTGISNEIPQLPYMTSYKFNNKYNANLNVDVVADCSNEKIEVSMNSIGKSLTASFQLSEERAVAYIGNQLQTSKETRNRFAKDVKYTVTYPGYNVILNVQVQDTLRDVKVPFGRIYTIVSNWLTDNCDVPRIDIDMIHSASSINKERYLDAKISISGFGMYDDFADSVQIKGRGNSTWSYSKKPYRLKFGSKVKPFGLTKGKSWVLLANAQRGALMANAIAMKVGQLIEVPYTNHIIPVELYINGEYMGSYMFTEHIGLSNNSVDQEEDLGYILELDSYFDEDYKFRSDKYNLPVNIKDPDLGDFSEDVREAKFNAIQADFAKFEDALYYNNGELGKYLDLDVAARFIMVNELVLNKELCHPKSTYLWKGDIYSPESKITFGPLWDFDWAFGYENTGTYFDIDYRLKLLSMGGDGKNFFQALMSNEEFLTHYYKVWKEFIEAKHIKEVNEYISDYYSFVEPSFENNHNLWGDGNEYRAKIIQMQNWMKNRHNYIASLLTEYDITDLIHTLLGDIDCNDLLTIRDVALLNDYLNGSTENEGFNMKKADSDKNGEIDEEDLDTTVKLLANGESVPSLYHYNTPVSKAALMATDGNSTENITAVPVFLQNDTQEEIKAIQADITIPAGVSIENITAQNSSQGDTVVYAQITNEQYRIVAYNKNGSSFVCDNPIFNIELNNSLHSGEESFVAQMKDILVVDGINLEKRIKETQFEINITTNIVSVADTDVTINVYGNSIIVTGADNSSVSIYTTSGTLVKGIDNYTGEAIVLDNGLYIVRTKNKTIKVKL